MRGEADQPARRRVKNHVMAAALPVATEQPPFLGVELRVEQRGIAADVAVELGERLGDVLEHGALGLLGRDEPQHQRLVNLGEHAVDRPLRVDIGQKRQKVLDDRGSIGRDGVRILVAAERLDVVGRGIAHGERAQCPAIGAAAARCWDQRGPILAQLRGGQQPGLEPLAGARLAPLRRRPEQAPLGGDLDVDDERVVGEAAGQDAAGEGLWDGASQTFSERES